MPKACNLKKGNVVEINGNIYSVKDIDVKSPSSRGAQTLYKVTFTGIKSKNQYKETYKGNDYILDADLSKRDIQVLYKDSQTCTFMDLETFNQHVIDISEIGNILNWITEETEGIIGSFLDDSLLCIEIPSSVSLEIKDTPPVVKGSAGAGNRTKEATLITGAIIQVPEFISIGDTVKINTETGKFLSRA